MTDEVSQSELRATWEAAAAGWAKWEKSLSHNLVAATDMMLDSAGIVPDMKVLDLACGAGSQTLQAASRIGEGGRIVACDISAEMLEHVRNNAAHAQIKNIETIESPAEELAFVDDFFDAAISRLGLMLFASPKSALSAVMRVLKPQAKFAALVFTTPQNNTFMAQPMGILLRHAGKQPPPPGQPGIFALGSHGKLEHVMQQCGLSDYQETVVRTPLRLDSVDEALAMMQQAFGAYRAVIAQLNDDDKLAAWTEVKECLQQFEIHDGFEAEMELVIGSATKPG